MKLQFTKMHALENDFILIDSRRVRLRNISKLAKLLCNRRSGVGADQLLLLGNSRRADFRMRIFNSDGSEVEMCGNGVRCLGKYIWDNVRTKGAGVKKSILEIDTLAGPVGLRKQGNAIEVDMGEPVFEPEKIPVIISHKSRVRSNNRNVPASSMTDGADRGIVRYPLHLDNTTFEVTCVSMGNPHAVITVDRVKDVDVGRYGPLIEHHRFFPKRTNVEFIQILNRNSLKMRVWERGAGETMACGTGASASGVASSTLGLTSRKAMVNLPGGKLLINWSSDNNHVYMTGDAVKVFDGTIEV